MAKSVLSKTHIIIVIVGAIVIFVIGFFVGDSYRVNKIKSALSGFGSGSSASELTKEKKIVDKKLGEEIDITKMKIKVNKSEEKNSISGGFDAKSAKEGTKFVVVDLNITNTTDGKFTFNPNSTLQLVDNQNRKYETYEDSIGYIDNYLDMRELSPSITEGGFLVYEIPNDSTSYSLLIDKDGSNERYKVGLK